MNIEDKRKSLDIAANLIVGLAGGALLGSWFGITGSICVGIAGAVVMVVMGIKNQRNADRNKTT